MMEGAPKPNEQRKPDIENLENPVEKEIDEQVSKLEENVHDLEQTITDIGGEAGLQDKLDIDDLFASRLTDRWNMKKNLVYTALLGLSAAGVGYLDSQILPQLNWEVPDDKTLGQYLTAQTVILIATSAMAIKKYMEYRKRVKTADNLGL